MYGMVCWVEGSRMIDTLYEDKVMYEIWKFEEKNLGRSNGID